MSLKYPLPYVHCQVALSHYSCSQRACNLMKEIRISIQQIFIGHLQQITHGCHRNAKKDEKGKV